MILGISGRRVVHALLGITVAYVGPLHAQVDTGGIDLSPGRIARDYVIDSMLRERTASPNPAGARVGADLFRIHFDPSNDERTRAEREAYTINSD